MGAGFSDQVDRILQVTEDQLKALVVEERLHRQGYRFDLKAFCHPKQFEFVTDPAPYATAVTSRRAGKTVGCAADLLHTAIATPGMTCLYVTLTRSNAKKLIWPMLEQINRKYRLGGEPNQSDLTMTFRNDSRIFLAGVNDSSAIHQFRGLALKLVYLDEAQSMRAYVQELIDDVLGPALIDHNGRLRVTGSPSPVPAGYFHEISHSEEWAHHGFTIWDNPFIKNAKERLELELKRRGIGIDHPSIQREYFGKWALDLDALVIQYDASVAHFEALPAIKGKWDRILAIDVGFEDSDALAVIAFAHEVPCSYLEEELVKSKQGITELAVQIESLIRKYDPIKIVMDTGGLGKKIAEEIRRRYAIPIEAADKQRKFEYIELLNDALRTGRFRAKRNSMFAQDAMVLEWEVDREKQKRVVSDRFHSDIIDAVLYGFRESLHWTHEPERIRPQPGSAEALATQEREHWERVEAEIQKEKDEQSFWSDPFDG